MTANDSSKSPPTRDQLISALSLANVFYKEMRMMFRKDGVSRGFGFLEFHSEEQAKQFKNFHRVCTRVFDFWDQNF